MCLKYLVNKIETKKERKGGKIPEARRRKGRKMDMVFGDRQPCILTVTGRVV